MDKFNPSHLFLACPNDQKELIEYQDIFECRFCHKVYKKYASNVFEFMPSNCFKIDDEKNEFIKNYNKYYHQLFNQKLFLIPEIEFKAWGEMGKSTASGYKIFMEDEINLFKTLIKRHSNDMAIEISGGSGNYSIALAPEVKKMIHFDLDVKSINSAYQKSVKYNIIKNMLFIRGDYLQMPFHSNSFDLVLAPDCLERGEGHEKRLLSEIFRILKPGRRAIIDFHQKRSFSKNTSIKEYRLDEIKKLFKSLNINQFEIIPLGYVPAKLTFSELSYRLLDFLCKFIIKSKRLIAVIEK